MITLDIRGDKKLRTRFKKLEKQNPEANVRAMKKATAHLEYVVKDNLGGKILNIGTGHLRASITKQLRQGKKDIEGIVGTPVKYAPIHEYGGVITPVRAKALTIPLHRLIRGRARDYPGIFRLPNTPYLVRRKGNRGLQFMFVLKKMVKIPARRPFRISLKQAKKKILSLFHKEIKKLYK